MVIDVGTGLSIFGAAFGMWAWVVAWGVTIVRKEVKELRDAAMKTATSLEQHILLTERRLTMLETEFSFIRRYLTHDSSQPD